MNNQTSNKQASLIFLVGFMGVGKTSVGARLANLIGWPFVDLDHEIEQVAGSTIEELFRTRGEPNFRKLENEQLERVILLRKTVVALGGGTICDPENQGIVSRRGTTVWLDATIELIHSRIDTGSRPLAGALEEMESLLERRRPFYQKADIHIEVRNKSTDELATEILDHLKQTHLI